MKASEILHEDIAFSYPEIHSTRLNSLFTFVESGLRDQRVSVTYLGRGLKSASITDKKHDIKRADRLIGNANLHDERIYFYQFMTEALVGKQKHPLIIVDWSPINGSQIFQVLRASIPMGGRALTLYEEVYPESELNSEEAHQALLDRLGECLPEGTKPIIISDAIFRTPWFEAIERKQWYWVGRVRGNVLISQGNKEWHKCKYWFGQASNKPTSLGKVLYGKTTQFECDAVLYKGKTHGKIKKKKRGGKSQCTTDKYQQKKAKEPWLLVFRIPKSTVVTAQRVVNI